MNFEFNCEIIDFARGSTEYRDKTEQLSRINRFSNTFTAILFITVSLLACYYATHNSNIPILYVLFAVPIFIVTIVSIFLEEEIIEEITNSVLNSPPTIFTVHGKTIIGKPKIEQISPKRIRVTVSNARIVDPDITTIAYM